MEPAGTGTTTTTTTTTTAITAAAAGVLAAQDAIVFSGTGAEGVTPAAAAPAAAPAGTDVFWASLVRAQLCVQELQGAIEGRPDGDDRDRTSRDVWHHGHGAAAATAAPSVSCRCRSLGSTGESVSHQHVPTDGSVSPEFVPADGSSSHERRGLGSTYENFFRASTGGSISQEHRGHGPTDGSISPESTPLDESIFRKHRGHGSAHESIFRVPTDGTVSPKSVPMGGSVFHEHQGCGIAYESISHVSMGGSVSNEHCVPTDGNISPRSMSVDGSISPVSMPTDETVLQEHVPTDGTNSSKSTPMDETNSTKSVPTDGSISHQRVPKDGTISSESVPTDGSISHQHVPKDGSISPKSVPMDWSISPKSVPVDGSISQEHVPMDGSILPKSVPTDGIISPEDVPMGGRISPKALTMDWTISPKSVPTDGSIPPVHVPVDGSISPKFTPVGGTTSPKRWNPKCGEEEEEEDDEDDDGCSSREEDAEEEEDLEEEEPHFHTNPLFQSRVLAPTGAHRVPLYRPHGAALQPLLITEGDDGTGGTGGRPGCPPPTRTPPPLGCRPAGGDVGSTTERGPPRPPGLTLSDPRDLPPGSGTPPRSLWLQPEWGYWDPPGPLAPLELTPQGGDQDPPSPSYPPDVAPGGGDQDLPLPRPLTPPKPPLGGGYRTPPPPPDLPQGGGYQKPPTPPYQPMGGGYQPPPSPPSPLDFPQPPPSPPYQPMGGGYQPPPSPPSPLDFPQPPPSPPYQPIGGGYQPPPSPPNPLDFPQPPPSPPYQPIGGGYQPPPSPPNPLNFPQLPPGPPYQPMGGGYQPPPDHPQPPSPLSSLPPRGPPGLGVIRGAWGGPPVPGHGCAWLLASPDASCPGGEVVQGPPLPATPSPHPAMEELPPEMGEEPPPDPPASTHGCPPGGSAVTPALANGGQGRQGEAQRLAARLFHLDGFKKSQVAAFLRKNNDFSGMVAQEYLDFFQFGGQTLDQALRSFLQALVLTGETQERERILGHFSRRYHHCNPGAFPSPDAVHSLTCAIMLLNTDLHGQRLGRAMTSAEFVANLSGMMDGQDFPREQLKALYGSIRNEKLAWAEDEDEEEEEDTAGGGSLAPPGCKKSNPFLDLPGGTGAVTYRRGWLARKVLAEADGKKTPWGRRGWKPFQAVLKGTVLYFLKPGGRTGVPRRPPEPGPFPAPQEEEGPEAEEPLGVHHALAERASKYTKRPNVFRLQTADWRVFLFQAPTSEEMFSWISRINLVAALFSSPPFPAAVGSQRRFVRPILPAAPSRVPPEEQHRSHEEWMERVAQELFEHQRNLPEKRGRARDLDEYRLKKEYLLYERRRYETYVQVLETWINTGAQDLEGWEAQAGPVVAPPDPPTLTKAHSSPSLVPEPPIAPTVRVKRNISERRTVRKIVPKRNKNLL